MTGMFYATVDFGGGNVVGDIFDAIVAKYDATGTHLWSAAFGGPGTDAGNAIDVNASGEVLVGGEWEETKDLGGGLIQPLGVFDVFAVRFDGAGGQQWSDVFGNPASDFDDSHGYGCLISGSGDAYLTGDFEDTIDFGSGPLTAAGYDLFLARFCPVATGVEDVPAARSEFSIRSYPNPFNPTTVVSFELPLSDRTILTIHDVSGVRIRTAIDRDLPAGRHHYRWDGRDESGDAVASGIYFARLRQGSLNRSQKMVLVK